MKLIHVMVGSCRTKYPQDRKARIGIHGTNGTRKPCFGGPCFLRKNKMPIETDMNANSVPIFVNSASLPSGIKPEKIETRTKVIHVFTTGVFVFLFIFEKALGSSPSRLIE